MFLDDICHDNIEYIIAYLVPLLHKESDWNTIIFSLIAAIIGGAFVLLGVLITNNHNSALASKERESQEKTTILSLNEELRALVECYQPELENLFATLKQNKYLTETYCITQEYFSVYKNNVNKLGLIKNAELRNLFIKIHILLNRFIEDLLIYDKMYREMLNRRINFLSEVNPSVFDVNLYNNFDVATIINDIKADKNNFLKQSADRRIKFEQYLVNDTNEEETLHSKCIEMNELLNLIIVLYNKIQDFVNKEYAK